MRTWQKFLLGFVAVVALNYFYSFLFHIPRIHVIHLAMGYTIGVGVIYYLLFSEHAENAEMGSLLRKHGKDAHETLGGRLVITDREVDDKK